MSEWNDHIARALKHTEVSCSTEIIHKLETYGRVLTEWSERMNLTAIEDPSEIAQKHFADSLLPLAEIPQNAKCIDVGTGAGFPGVVIKIARPDIEITLLDSLNKRLGFLKALCEELEIEAEFVHSRAEDAAHKQEYRDAFDVAFSRAVAQAPVLMELVMPFVKTGGKALIYKGPNAHEEFQKASRALTVLKSKIASHKSYSVPWGTREIISIEKFASTPKNYPRKAGDPARNPL